MSDAFADAGRLRQELDSVWKMHDLLKRENADLRARLEEARKDAERYRWLRAHTGATRRFDRSQQFSFPRLEDEGVNLMHGSVAGHLDTAIDAAIAQGRGGK